MFTKHPLVTIQQGIRIFDSSDDDLPLFRRHKARSILCVPGPWRSRKEFILSLAKSSMTGTQPAFIAAGPVLLNSRTGKVFWLEFRDRDQRMRAAFNANGSKFSSDFLRAIDRHESVVYLSCATGHPKPLSALSDAARALVTAGGIGVKVETAGIAFTGAQWCDLMDDDPIENLRKLFVVDNTGGVNKVFSCRRLTGPGNHMGIGAHDGPDAQSHIGEPIAFRVFRLEQALRRAFRDDRGIVELVR